LTKKSCTVIITSIPSTSDIETLNFDLIITLEIIEIPCKGRVYTAI